MDIEQHVYVAQCKVKFAICKATLAAMEAISTDPHASDVVQRHNDECNDAYEELEAAKHHLESCCHSGSEEEWELLTDAQKSSQWDKFHSLCARGIGDSMYFYEVLMKQWQVGYVGH